jgi:hypothetical protein
VVGQGKRARAPKRYGKWPPNDITDRDTGLLAAPGVTATQGNRRVSCIAARI